MSELLVYELKDWEKIRELGTGGQSTVYLVRHPQRVAKRANDLEVIRSAMDQDRRADLAVAIVDYAREDEIDELGALKVFDKVRNEGAAPADRIKREIEILQQEYSNLPKLLDSNATEKWLVTEYFPNGVLESSPELFKGDALKALKALRPLVETVKLLHDAGVIHRDIKPANVFVASGERLVLGDFGIAFRPEPKDRLTVTHERVGPWDYMPQWADTGERLDEVKPSFDIYMLGKLLWCMVSGRHRLPREYHKRDQYNLTKMFPADPLMHSINSILDKCLVEHEHECLTSAEKLLREVDQAISIVGRRLVVHANGEIELPCFVCGNGLYKEETTYGRVELTSYNKNNIQQSPISVRVFCCNLCTHRAFFAPAYPDEAVKRNKI